MIIGGLWAPAVAGFEGVFNYIQIVWGFISPGIVAVFLFGILWSRVPAGAAIGAMLLGIPVYGILLVSLPQVAFLHHMMITFVVLSAFIVLYTFQRPLAVPRYMPQKTDIVLTSSPAARVWGSLVIAVTASLYVLFW